MPPITIQVLILAAGYAVALVVIGVATTVGLINYRSSLRLEVKKDAVARITRVENEIASYRELLDTFSKRLNREAGVTSRRAKKEAEEEPEETQEPRSGEDVLRLYNMRRNANG